MADDPKKKPAAKKKATAKKATKKSAAKKRPAAKKRAAKKATATKRAAGPATLSDLSPTNWEHPADRAALNALRKIPGFDGVLRKIVGLFGEKPIRLGLQANAVKVSAGQYSWVHEQLIDVCTTLDAPVPALYVTQDPAVNALSVGFDTPFIVLNSSLLEVLDEDEVATVIAHEVGHIESGHAVYSTMLFILLKLASVRYPLVGVTTQPIKYALLEWSRKAELSSDRAALLAVQDPTVVMTTLMKLAGGSRGETLNLDEFIAQSDEYRHEGDLLDRVYKFAAAIGTTHPFAVARVADLRDWIDSGAYDEIVSGSYRTRTDDQVSYAEDLGDAAGSYTAKAREVYDGAGKAVGQMTSKVAEAWRKGA